MPSAGSNNSSSAIETITDVDGGGKRGQNSGGLVTFHSAPFPLGRGCSLRTARSGQGRAGVARRSEPFTARTVLRSSTRGKGVALNGPLKWPSRSPPLTLRLGLPAYIRQAFGIVCDGHHPYMFAVGRPERRANRGHPELQSGEPPRLWQLPPTCLIERLVGCSYLL